MKIYIVQSMTGTKFSKLLKRITKNDFTHVSISLNKDLSELYSFGRRNLYIPIIAGFVHENINEGVFEKYDTYCEVLELNVSSQKYNKLKMIIENYKESYHNQRYNLIGLPLMLLNIPYARKNRYACSQFVAHVLELSNIWSFGKSWTIVRPFDFYDISGLKSIYKGKLNDYSDFIINEKNKKISINHKQYKNKSA